MVHRFGTGVVSSTQLGQSVVECKHKNWINIFFCQNNKNWRWTFNDTLNVFSCDWCGMWMHWHSVVNYLWLNEAVDDEYYQIWIKPRYGIMKYDLKYLKGFKRALNV